MRPHARLKAVTSTSIALLALTMGTTVQSAELSAPSTASLPSTSSSTGSNPSNAKTGSEKSISKKKAKIDARSAATSNTSVTRGTGTTSGFFSNIRMTYQGIFAGPSLAEPISVYKDKAHTQGASLLSQFLTSKPLGASGYNAGLGVVSRTLTGAGTALMDPFLRLNNGNVYSNGNYSVGGDIRLGLGISEASRNAGQLTYIRGMQSQDYQLGKSRFTASLTTIEQAFIYTNFKDKALLNLIAYPALAYQVNPKISVMAGSTVFSGLTAGSGFSAPSIDVDLGGDFTITDSLSISPSINLQPQAGISLETSTINAFVSWRLL